MLRFAWSLDSAAISAVAEIPRQAMKSSGVVRRNSAHCAKASFSARTAAIQSIVGKRQGYPLYRLEWQGMGSLQRRLRGCMTGVRAEPFAYGAPELIELEFYLAQRAAGMRLDAPAVRP